MTRRPTNLDDHRLPYVRQRVARMTTNKRIDNGSMDNDDNDKDNDDNWQDDDFLILGPAESTKNGDNSKQDDNDNDGEEEEEKDELPAIGTHDNNAVAPWMMKRIQCWNSPRGGGSASPFDKYQVHPAVRLHNEIVTFCKLMEPQPLEKQVRSDWLHKFTHVAESTFPGVSLVAACCCVCMVPQSPAFQFSKCQVQVFGSQATGLFLPSSDIDVCIVLADFKEKENDNDDEKKKKDANGGDASSGHDKGKEELSKAEQKAQEQQEMDDWNIADGPSSPLHQLADALHREWKDDLTYLEVIENTRVPLVKFTVGSETTTKSKNVSFDVCFNQTTGPKAAALIKTYLQAMPPLRPLTFVLKYFLASRELNIPYAGGVGSYLLQLMIVSFLQHRSRDEYNFRRPSPYNLGCLLLEFLELYGMDLNYVTTGVSVRFDGFYFAKGHHQLKEHFYTVGRPNLLAFENPLEPTMDVGKSSFKINVVARSFEVAFKVLLAHLTEPRIESLSILASILPITSEMILRQQEQQEETGQVGSQGGKHSRSHHDNRRKRRRLL